MRKIILSVLFSGIFAAAYSQTETGDWMIGGNFRLNTSDNNTQIGFTPSAGYFVIKNLALGGNVTMSYSKEGSVKRSEFGAGPFARYYFNATNVRPILHGSLSFVSQKTKVSTPLTTTTTTNSGINYFLGGGAAAFISEQVSIDGLIGYAYSNVGTGSSGGFAFNIGFQVYLLKRQVDKLQKQ